MRRCYAPPRQVRDLEASLEELQLQLGQGGAAASEVEAEAAAGRAVTSATSTATLAAIRRRIMGHCLSRYRRAVSVPQWVTRGGRMDGN